MFARQLPKGEDYTTLKPVNSLNFLEYEISRKGPWLHHFRLPQTAHLGFIFVELPKLLRSPGSRALLKKAAIWGRFLEKPETSPANGPADLVALLGAAKQRMEAYLMLEPEVYREIHESMEHHDYVSVRGEGYREGEAVGEARGEARGIEKGKAEVAIALLDEGMSPAKVAELTGLQPPEVEKLQSQRKTTQRG